MLSDQEPKVLHEVERPFMARIGVALRAVRTQRQLSQSDLGRLAGVSPSAISQAERGQRGLSLETLLELTGQLNISVDELLRGEVIAGYRLGRRDHPRTRRINSAHQPLPLLDDRPSRFLPAPPGRGQAHQAGYAGGHGRV